MPGAEREDRIDAFLLDRPDDEIAAVYHGHGGASFPEFVGKNSHRQY